MFGLWFFAEGKRADGSVRGTGLRHAIRSSRNVTSFVHCLFVTSYAGTIAWWQPWAQPATSCNSLAAYHSVVSIDHPDFCCKTTRQFLLYMHSSLFPCTLVRSDHVLIHFLRGLAFVRRHKFNLLPLLLQISSAPYSKFIHASILMILYFRLIALSCTDSLERERPIYTHFCVGCTALMI